MGKIDLTGKTVLVTGAAGFIGSSLAAELLKRISGITVVGIDDMNDYYDVRLKEWRLKETEKEAAKHPGSRYCFIRGDIADKAAVEQLFAGYRPQVVVNLAAQAGVRYSITHPDAYIRSNLIGFYNLCEACRHSCDDGAEGVMHFVYASSSSVYGNTAAVPYSTDDRADRPVSLYAATKRSDELIAHAYSKLYEIPSTGLRFFTVYGPAGRPDMAYFGFTDKFVRSETVRLFNYGNCRRDFTYIDDITEGILRVMQQAPEKKTGEDGLPVPPYALYNIGNRHPENLEYFVTTLKDALVKTGILPAGFDLESHLERVPMQPGDVVETCADTTELERDFGFKPSTSLQDGLMKFAEWYKDYYGKQ